MDIIITEEQRQNVVKYLRGLLAVFDTQSNFGDPNPVKFAAEKKEQTDPSTLVWKTFKEWSDDGYRILKGERATRIDGVCKFSNEQVRQNEARPTKGLQYDLPDDGQHSDPADDDVPF